MTHFETLPLVPRPVLLRSMAGRFDLRQAFAVVCQDTILRQEADRFAAKLSTWTGRDVPSTDTAGGAVVRIVARANDGNDESYELTIAPGEVRIIAGAAVGAFRATQTLTQLLPPAAHATPAKPIDGPLAWPCVEIADRPRFKWRGLMLDVCRHVFPKADILRHLDAMALHKLNVFHWHLTDDQGWRIFIDRHPDLAKKGGYRDGGDGVLSPSRGPLLTPAPGRYGGYYTKQDVRDVVAYAAERHITVVPEIEMPGHALAALTAYPDLACATGTYSPATQMGVFKDVFCAGNDRTLQVLEDVLAEVADLFPGPFVHVGGDECPKDRWRDCPKCQARIRAEGLGDEHGLQSYVVRRMQKFLAARGKRLIGWDEILEGGLAEGATVMSWRGTEGGIAAARAGNDVVMTPHYQVYFDYRQAETGEPLSIPSANPVTVESVYAYEPVPAELTAEQARHIYGVQANLWTEYVHDFKHAEYMYWPRGAALAEVVWSPTAGKDWADFERRLAAHVDRLDAANVRYRPLDAATAQCGVGVSPT